MLHQNCTAFLLQTEEELKIKKIREIRYNKIRYHHVTSKSENDHNNLKAIFSVKVKE
jgi:hypothetical protein